MSVFEIIPLAVGSRQADTSLLLYLTEAGTPVTIHYRLWVLRSRSRTVLVDTGLPAAECAERGVHDGRDVEEVLRSVGVEVTDIDTIVLTHFHWDHASNADRFPRATFVVQRAELEALSDPVRDHPSVGRFYSADTEKFHELHARGRLQVVDGDTPLLSGLQVLHLGGHTRGSQAVAVATMEGPAVITGDAVPLNRNLLDNIPNAVHIDLADAIHALDRVRRLDAVVVYTAHDQTSTLLVPAHASFGVV